MRANNLIIKDFFQDLIKIGGRISSESYIKIVINDMLKQKSEPFLFLNYIKIGDDVNIDEKLNNYPKELLLKPLNEIINFMLFDTSKKLFLEFIDSKRIDEYLEFGFKITEKHK